jgi:hypothetical protein
MILPMVVDSPAKVVKRIAVKKFEPISKPELIE